MTYQVVRRIGSERTHVMNVTETRTNTLFGVEYEEPYPARAACGVRVYDGVVMRAGTKTRCSTCRHLTGLTEQP